MPAPPRRRSRMTRDDTTLAHDDLPRHHGSRRRRARRRRGHHRDLPALPGPRGRASRSRLVEAGGGVGGTWYWNRYPGARFDSESYTYGYLFSRELFDEWEWQEHFARPARDRALPQPRGRPLRPPPPHPLRRQGHLGRVRRAVGDLAVTLGDGTPIRARFLIAATGVLSVPYLPDVPGRDDFRGEAHHTGALAGRAGRLRGQAGRGDRHLVERRAGRPHDPRRRRVSSPSTSAPPTGARRSTTRPITPEEQVAAAGRLRGSSARP